MSNTFLTTSAIAAIGLVVASSSVPAQRAVRERHVVVSVAGSNDAPVTNLTARDFIVREDDIAREIIRVTPAAPPSHVAFVIDTSDVVELMIPDLRDAVAAASGRLAALENAPRQSLVTVGERPTRVVNFTTRAADVQDAARRLTYRPGTGAHVIDGVVETAQALGRTEATRPAIVVFSVAAGVEFSTADRRRAEDELKRARVTLWTIDLRGAGDSASSPENLERDAVIGDVARRTGGFSKSVLSKEGLGQAFATVLGLVTNAYDIAYGRPESLIPPSKIAVTTRNASERTFAAQWTE